MTDMIVEEWDTDRLIDLALNREALKQIAQANDDPLNKMVIPIDEAVTEMHKIAEWIEAIK